MARKPRRPNVTLTCPECSGQFMVRQSRIEKTQRDICCSRECECRRRTRPMADRFWEKVQRTKSCWLWMGSVNRAGYGQINDGRRPQLAHRVAWELTFGPIPDGLCALHDCPDGDNPRCVNPEHLFIGTQLDNIADAIRKTRNTKGSQFPQAKLTDDSVREMRKRYAAGGITQQRLADEYGVTNGIICEILSRKRWAHVA